VACCAQDLHSGVLGGSVHEAMTDLIHLMASLVDSYGKILVPAVYDDVKPVDAAEEALYDQIDFELEDFMNENKIITGKLLHGDKKSLLMHRWRHPTLSLHGIEGAFSSTGAKTVRFHVYNDNVPNKIGVYPGPFYSFERSFFIGNSCQSHW
jgi:nonspecific dipeptidase